MKNELLIMNGDLLEEFSGNESYHRHKQSDTKFRDHCSRQLCPDICRSTTSLNIVGPLHWTIICIDVLIVDVGHDDIPTIR